LKSATLAGVSLAIPPLEAMLGAERARAQTTARHLVLFTFPNGVFLPDWFPSGTGTTYTPSALMRRQADDPAAIDGDLESIRGDVVVVSGLSNSRLKTDAHESTNNSFLTGTLNRADRTPTGPSVDTVAGEALGASSHFPVLRISLTQNLLSDMPATVSFGEGGRPIQATSSPRLLYESMTGLVSAGEDTSAADYQRAFRRSVLDHVGEDLARLQGVCGLGDRRILEEHADSIRDLERRLDTLAPVSCDLPDLTGDLATLPDADARYSGYWPNTPNSENLPLRVDVLQRIALIALRCELTRVVLFSIGPSNSRQTYPFLGMGNTDDHFFSHLQQEPGNRARQLEWNRLTRWKMSAFVRLVNAMKAPGATGSSLLDESVVVCASELANGAGHTSDLLPVVVAGNVGAMSRPENRGRHLVLPCDPAAIAFNNPETGMRTPVGDVAPGLCGGAGAYTPLSNLWATALRGLGIEGSFGDATGTIDGLWT
jgi:hypothetical protein